MLENWVRMSTRLLCRSALILGVAALSAAGCRKPKDPGTETTTESLALDGSDSSEIESHVSSLTAAVTLSTSSFDPARAAEAATSTKSFFTAGCVTTEVVGTTATHTFKGCAGPWGLLRLNGKLTVTYSATTVDGNPALELEVTGDEISVRGATVDFHAKAQLWSPGGAERKMTYHAELAGKTARDREIARTVAWNLGWRVGDTCLRVDGTAEGNITGRSLKTTIENYQRCRGLCPAAGGVITIESGDKKIRIEYDGTARATVIAPDGTKSIVRLGCGLL